MTTAAPPQAQRGNLESLLSSYDHAVKDQNMSQPLAHAPSVIATGSITINVPGGSVNHHDEEGRERSLTMGSEFDLGWVMGKDGRGMSFSGLLTPMENPAVDGMSSCEGTTTTTVSGSTSSTHHSAHGAGPSETVALEGHHNHDVPETAYSSLLPSLPENTTAHKSSSLLIPGRARGDSTASQFLYGIYQQQQQQPALVHSQMIAHTPPTQISTSYENKHFGKRSRSGSISGRLRSASDLEDTGVISREQKAILKDLIISGDNSVQGAIDKYEAGDPTALEAMIKSGALLARSSDVDLLGDLDLDFLNVHGDDDGMMFGDMDDITGSANNAQRSISQRGQSPVDDGIGDLEFNGDFSNHSMEPKQVVGNPSHNALRGPKSRGNSVDGLEVYRMRANSLALPGLLLDGANPDDVTSYNFGRWMDKDVEGPSHAAPAPVQGALALHQLQYTPNVVAVNDSQQILNPQLSSECDVLMASRSKGSLTPATLKKGKKPKVKKEKNKKTPSSKKVKEKKDKNEPRERKSQSKMKDMMESISGTAAAVVTPAGEEEESKEIPSGLGRPRSMSDPNLSVHLDDFGLLHVNGPDGWVGAYSPDSRQMRVNRFLEKRNHRVWVKKVKYDVRKNFADSRLRVKGRFVKKEDEMLMRELMSLT